MRTVDLYVADRGSYDAFVQHPIALSRLRETFCFKLSSPGRDDGDRARHAAQAVLDADCLRSPHVELCTFIGDDRIVEPMDAVWEQVATLYLQFVVRSSSADASGGATTLANEPELRQHIVAACKQQWERNYAHFVRTAALHEVDKRRRNLACGKLLRAMLRQAPMRFRAFRCEHTYPLPFVPGDRIHFGCTVHSYRGLQRYDVRLVVADE